MSDKSLPLRRLSWWAIFGFFIVWSLLPGKSNAAGSFSVNTDADENIRNEFLSFREAILVDTGQLKGPFTDGERDQLGGCNFSGSEDNWSIVGGCGEGIADVILFTENMRIVISDALNPLPQMSDDGTTVYPSGSAVVQIDGNNVSGHVLRITGSNVTIKGLRIYGAGPGWANVLIDETAKMIVIADNIIGDDDHDFGGCGESPNSEAGIYIRSRSEVFENEVRAWIYGNLIECIGGGSGGGIVIEQSDRVVIGADEVGASDENQANEIGNNQESGISIGSGASNNFIFNSSVNNNGGDGILIEEANNNSIGGEVNEQEKSNSFSENGGNGITVTGSEGTFIGINEIVGNIGNGVWLNSSSETKVRSALVTNNGEAGIVVQGESSLGNDLRFDEIHSNGGLSIDLNGDGQTYNDAGDDDIGPNNLLNYPVITFSDEFVLGGTVCPSCFVDIYGAEGTPGLFGSGGYYLTSVIADGDGNWDANLISLGVLGKDVSVVAVDQGGDTSEMRPFPLLYLPSLVK